MYGAKRLTIEKSGMIVIQGNRSYNPIGKFFNVNGEVVGKLRKIENPFETKLDETNSVDFKFTNVSELRKFVKTTYASEL
jgi:hypothetical protein